MSFIKTPYTMFEVVSETPIVYNVRAKWTPNHIYAKSKCQTKVIKQGDTIEETCDAFVVKVGDGYLILDHYDKELLTKATLQNDVIIYGAIWTSKGLIFVAKMNEKVELKLL